MLHLRVVRGLAVLTVMVGWSLAATSGTASATACGGAVASGSNCTLTGTVTLTAGTLTLTSPSSLTWASTLTGLDQSVVDTVSGDQQYTVTATSAPTASCSGTCSLPSNSTTYPVAITTAASSPVPVTIYDTAAASGLGQIVIGGSTQPNPVGWWANIPANASAGSYTSVITMAVISGP